MFTIFFIFKCVKTLDAVLYQIMRIRKSNWDFEALAMNRYKILQTTLLNLVL